MDISIRETFCEILSGLVVLLLVFAGIDLAGVSPVGATLCTIAEAASLGDVAT